MDKSYIDWMIQLQIVNIILLIYMNYNNVVKVKNKNLLKLILQEIKLLLLLIIKLICRKMNIMIIKFNINYKKNIHIINLNKLLWI